MCRGYISTADISRHWTPVLSVHCVVAYQGGHRADRYGVVASSQGDTVRLTANGQNSEQTPHSHRQPPGRRHSGTSRGSLRGHPISLGAWDESDSRSVLNL